MGKNKSQKQRYNTHMVQPWLRHAPKNQIVEPRKYNSKLSFVGVRCSSCKQIQKKRAHPLYYSLLSKRVIAAPPIGPLTPPPPTTYLLIFLGSHQILFKTCS